MRAAEVTEQFGGSYAAQLGIDLDSGQSSEIYKWFLASVLFGARISETTAIHTYREFERAGALSPRKILDAGWDKLVEILDRGGYTRYDFKTATKLLNVNQALIEQYGGDLNVLHQRSKGASDLEQCLKNLGKGIGEVTVNIFLRELRGIWRKAEPLPSELVVAAAQVLGFLPDEVTDGRCVLDGLTARWRTEGKKQKDFPHFEAALVRYGKTLRKNAARLARGNQ